jgi:hypothetical protein
MALRHMIRAAMAWFGAVPRGCARKRSGPRGATVALAVLMACSAAASASARVVQTIGTTGELRLRLPEDAAIGPSGEIYVLDQGDSASSPVLIKVYSPGGRLVRSWGVGRLLEQGGVPFMAVDPAGNAYIGAPPMNEILKYSAAGQLLARWRLGNGEQDYPVSLAVDRDGNVLVVKANGRIETFDGAGQLLTSWQQSASSLAVATSGTICIADQKGIAVLGASGSVVSRLVQVGDRPGRVSNPRLIAGPAGSLYAVERQRIQKFGPDGEFLGSVGLDRRAQTSSAAVAGDGTIFVPQWLFGGGNGALLKLAPITTVDVTRPSITVKSLSSPPIKRRRANPAMPVLARLTYRLSEAESFRVSLKRRASTKDRSSKYFGRYFYKGTIDLALTPAGRHTLVLDWRSFHYERPSPGDYLLVLVARDDAGNEALPARVKFTVHRR